MRIRGVLAAGVAAFASVALVACSGGTPTEESTTTSAAADETTTPAAEETTAEAPAAGSIPLRVLTWTSNPDQLAVFDEIATAFEAEHPEVSGITFENVAAADLPTVLTTQLLAGDPPDLSWLAIEDSSYFINAGVLADLQPTLEATDGYDVDDLIPDLMTNWVRGDAKYGIPMSTSGRAFYYNADLFAAAGVDNPSEMIANGTYTWENFADNVKVVAEKTGLPGYILPGLKWSDSLVPLLYAYGARPWNDDATECTMTSPEAVEAMSLLHRMIFDDKSVPLPSTTQNFWGGQGGSQAAYISSATSLKDATFEWGAVPGPAGPAGDTQQVGQTAWVVYDAGKHADLAAQFVAFLTNQDSAQKLAKFFAPVRASLLTPETINAALPILSVEQLTPLVEAAKTGQVAPIPNNAAKTNLALDSALNQYFYQPEIDVAAAMQSVCDAIASPLLLK